MFSSSYSAFLNTSSSKCSAALGFNKFFKNYIQAANQIFRKAMRDQPTSHLPTALNRAVSAGGWWVKSQAAIKADKPEYKIWACENALITPLLSWSECQKLEGYKKPCLPFRSKSHHTPLKYTLNSHVAISFCYLVYIWPRPVLDFNSQRQ